MDGGSGVNVMTEQMAIDLGYTSFESTPKILRMANQEEVVPLGKISRVLTRLDEPEYALNYVVIKLPRYFFCLFYSIRKTLVVQSKCVGGLDKEGILYRTSPDFLGNFPRKIRSNSI
jgi:hypothetical protein